MYERENNPRNRLLSMMVIKILFSLNSLWKYVEAFSAIKIYIFLFLRSHRNTVIASPNGGNSVFNNSRTATSSSNSNNMSSSQGINNHNDINSIHQFSSQAHPVTATSTTTASQISQQINGSEVVNNKSRQILINHSNDANAGMMSESYLHSQQQVKVSHHETSPKEIRFESMKNLSVANQSTMTNAISPAGRKVSAGDENAMITIVTINNSNSSHAVA